MSQNRGSNTLISWLHNRAATATFQHVKTTIPTESYRNSGLEALGFLQITLAAQQKMPWTGGFAVAA